MLEKIKTVNSVREELNIPAKKQSELSSELEKLVNSGLTSEHIDLWLQNFNPGDNVKRFEMITAEMAFLYARKNKDYGNSFDESLNEDGLIVAKVRKGDKQRRFAQLIKNDAEVKDESIRDTLIDDAAYSIMTVMWMDAKAEIEQARKMIAASNEKTKGPMLSEKNIPGFGMLAADFIKNVNHDPRDVKYD